MGEILKFLKMAEEGRPCVPCTPSESNGQILAFLKMAEEGKPYTGGAVPSSQDNEVKYRRGISYVK